VAAGATFAVKELNARGSILGRQIELLDEPLMGLAPTVIEEIRHALNMLRQDG
jgi:ABC-type branched-subunit amino acid transport system ATPase component